MRAALLLMLALAGVIPAWTEPALAETSRVTLPRQYGITFLPFLEMEEGRLIEKHARALGLPDLQVEWVVLSGAGPVNDGLLSGALSFGAGAAPSLVLLWDRTRASPNPVRGIGAIAAMPTYLNTRNPAIASIADYTEADRIALPSVKLSNAAIVLQMAAAKLWGDAEYARLDPLTVSLGHPDAMAQLLGGGGITSHFASPPYQALELRTTGVRTILTSVEVMGDASLTDVWTTQRFLRDNPAVVQAVFDAMQEAVDTINRDKGAAADLYLRLSHDRIARADLMRVLDDPHVIYSTTPMGTMAFAGFMRKVGVVRAAAADWRDLFFPIAHALPGN